jgi:hypothetical protein
MKEFYPLVVSEPQAQRAQAVLGIEESMIALKQTYSKQGGYLSMWMRLKKVTN